MGKKLLALALAITGSAALFLAYRAHVSSREAKEWPTVTGRVLTSEVEGERVRRSGTEAHTHPQTYRIMYTPRVIYEYFVGDTGYSSDRVTLSRTSSSNPDDARRVTERYPAGSEVRVYYNPSDPSRALLEPAETDLHIPIIVGFIFLAAALLFAKAP